jgi:hypothetical protein
MNNLPAERFMLGMQSMNANLGVGCEHCHDLRDFTADTKQPKETARTMLKMAFDIDTRFFAGRTNVTCFTCHRRDAQPEPFTPTKPAPEWPLDKLSGAQAEKPAKEVYKNLQVLGGMPAGRLSEAMTAFSTALGVGCAHCHSKSGWDSDEKPAKKRAREMLAMVHDIGETYFAGGKNPVRCATCHRGDVRPARVAGPMVHVALTPTAKRVLVVLGPTSFAPKTWGDMHKVMGPAVDAAQFTREMAYQSAEAELGHITPGAYSLCVVPAPEHGGPEKNPADPVACAPATVAPEPDVQTLNATVPAAP